MKDSLVDKKIPHAVENAHDTFKKDNVDLSPLLKARKSTAVVDKTLNKYQGEFAYAQKRHLLNRVLVGYSERHMKDLDGLNLDQAIDLIFSKQELGEPVNNYYHDFPPEAYKKKYNVADVQPGQPFISKALSGDERSGFPVEFAGPERGNALDSWVYHSIYAQPTSVHWRLFMFLHTLTPYKEDNVKIKSTFYSLKLTYEGAWRSYKDYIYDVTLSDKMLELLNLRYSRKEAPDENFAREVQELFTVGKRPFSKFTESDVKEAARLLVGWDYDERPSLIDEGYVTKFRFNADNHDTKDKQFSAFYGNKLIKGRSGQDGKLETKEFFDMLFETEETAIYLCRRLVQFFIYPVLNNYVEENIIKPLAKVLRTNNYCLAEALKVLLKSEYFFAQEFHFSMIKSPMEYSMGLYKELEIINGYVANDTYNAWFEQDRANFDSKYLDKIYLSFKIFSQVRYHAIGRQGYSFGNPPSVSGWQAYYQEPVYDLIWINSDSIKRRKDLAESIAMNGLNFFDQNKLRFDMKNLLKKTKEPANINAFIPDLAKIFLGLSISDKVVNRIKKSILGEGFQDYYWTDAVNAFLNNPSKENYNTLYVRLSQILVQLFDLNEIHVF